jgi:hypothetical protein
MADPGCVEAHLALAEASPDDKTKIRHLLLACGHGGRLWHETSLRYGDRMRWWEFLGTRPYLRAIKALGDAHLGRGELEDAQSRYQQLLRMDPADHQGAALRLAEIDRTAPKI